MIASTLPIPQVEISTKVEGKIKEGNDETIKSIETKRCIIIAIKKLLTPSHHHHQCEPFANLDDYN